MTTNQNTLRLDEHYSKLGHTHGPNEITYDGNKHLSNYIEEKIESDKIATYSILLSNSSNIGSGIIDGKCLKMVQYGSDNKIYASVKKNGIIQDTGFVVFVANGVTYTKEISSTTKLAVLNISWNNIGTYDIFASYIGNPDNITNNSKKSSYAYCMEHCLVEIIPEYEMTTNDYTKTFGTSGQFQATLKQRDTNNTSMSGEPIIFTINGVSYVRTTNTQGIASLNINLQPGIYPITTVYEYEINNQVRKIQKTNTVTIDTNYILTTNDLISEVTETGKFEVELIKKDGTKVSGKTILFTISDVTYKRTTKADGTATMDINLGYNPTTGQAGTPGTYPITTQCTITEGSTTYTLKNNNVVIRYNPNVAS